MLNLDIEYPIKVNGLKFHAVITRETNLVTVEIKLGEKTLETKEFRERITVREVIDMAKSRMSTFFYNELPKIVSKEGTDGEFW